MENDAQKGVKILRDTYNISRYKRCSIWHDADNAVFTGQEFWGKYGPRE